MKRSFLRILVAVANGTLSIVSVQAAAETTDPVRAGFERMLAPLPVHSVNVTRPDIGTDPLIEAVSIPLREWPHQSGGATTIADPLDRAPYDSLAAGYANMLNHTPSRHTVTVDRERAADPLHAALVVPVRDWLAAQAEHERRAITNTAQAPAAE